MTVFAAVADFFFKAPVLFALVQLMAIDIFVGIAAAFVSKSVRSDTARDGMVKKCIVLMLVGTGHVLQIVFPQIPWGAVFASFFCASEAISILKNASNAGIKLPEKLTAALQEITRSATTATVTTTVTVPIPQGGEKKDDGTHDGYQG